MSSMHRTDEVTLETHEDMFDADSDVDDDPDVARAMQQMRQTTPSLSPSPFPPTLIDDREAI